LLRISFKSPKINNIVEKKVSILMPETAQETKTESKKEENGDKMGSLTACEYKTGRY
jgi:hypothetical protein